MLATRQCLSCGCAWNSSSPPTIVHPPLKPCQHPQITLVKKQHVGNEFYNDAKVTAGCITALESLATTYFDDHFLKSPTCQWGKTREGVKDELLHTSEILRHAEICHEFQPFIECTGSGKGTLLSNFMRLSSDLQSKNAGLSVDDVSVIIPGHLEDCEKRTLHRMLVAQGNRVRVLDEHKERVRDAYTAEMKTPVTSPAATVSGESSPASSPPLSTRQAFEGRAAV